MKSNNKYRPSKKVKVSSKKPINFDLLPWKEVTLGEEVLADDEFGGFTGLEEIDGIDLQQFDQPSDETLPTKSTSKKKTKKSSNKATEACDGSTENIDENENTTNSSTSDPSGSETKPQSKAKDNKRKNVEEEKEFIFDRSFVKEWEQFGFSETLLQALHKLKFRSPTSIQLSAIPQALLHKDIIGCAETGSGKTLAFGLPLIQRLINSNYALESGDLFGLILSPTRELAMQTTASLKAVSQFNKIKIAAIVGGMSIQKQERLLENSPHVIVATPGRLWELISQNPSYENKIKNLKVLVIDEADRMVEKGHFKELDSLINLLNQKSQEGKRRQTLLFSATLDNSTQKKKHDHIKASIDDIIKKVQLKDKKPITIDLTSKKLTSENLVERRIDCTAANKDKYLYFLVTKYPGRTLVFVNSIDTIRRLIPFLVLLGVNAFPLHAQMQQRQRLKNVDRFKNLECSVLVASDVASRGLDIPGVEHIIHYQLARTPELYIHRSGRTARAQREGLSIMLCSPEELKSYRQLCIFLKRSSIPEFPIDNIMVSKLGPRVVLAKKIDALQHKLNKISSDKNWFTKNAAEMEIELDSDFLPDSDSEDNDNNSRSNTLIQIAKLKTELTNMLQVSLLPVGTTSYITSGVHSQLVHNLSQSSGTFRGFNSSNALSDAQISKK